jgi:holo-[acyl-carrier protein] synthase
VGEPSVALSVGVDAVEIPRIRDIYARFGERFLERVYTERERARYRGRINELAARFGAKEATSKVLGVGLKGMGWQDVEVMPDPRGKPLVTLYGRARERAAQLGLTEFAISITHTTDLAIVVVVAT